MFAQCPQCDVVNCCLSESLACKRKSLSVFPALDADGCHAMQRQRLAARFPSSASNLYGLLEQALSKFKIAFRSGDMSANTGNLGMYAGCRCPHRHVTSFHYFKETRFQKLAAAFNQNSCDSPGISSFGIHQSRLLPFSDLHKVIGVLIFERAHARLSDLCFQTATKEPAEHWMERKLLHLATLDL